jgi:hypothetical protein
MNVFKTPTNLNSVLKPTTKLMTFNKLYKMSICNLWIKWTLLSQSRVNAHKSKPRRCLSQLFRKNSNSMEPLVCKTILPKLSKKSQRKRNLKNHSMNSIWTKTRWNHKLYKITEISGETRNAWMTPQALIHHTTTTQMPRTWVTMEMRDQSLSKKSLSG